MSYIITTSDATEHVISDEDFTIISEKMKKMTTSRLNFLELDNGIVNTDHVVSIIKSATKRKVNNKVL